MHSHTAPGDRFAEAVRDEIERQGLGALVAVVHLPDEGVVRLTVAGVGKAPGRALEFPPTLGSIQPIVHYLQTFRRISSIRKTVGLDEVTDPLRLTGASSRPV
jgi:hypothetical protein